MPDDPLLSNDCEPEITASRYAIRDESRFDRSASARTYCPSPELRQCPSCCRCWSTSSFSVDQRASRCRTDYRNSVAKLQWKWRGLETERPFDLLHIRHRHFVSRLGAQVLADYVYVFTYLDVLWGESNKDPRIHGSYSRMDPRVDGPLTLPQAKSTCADRPGPSSEALSL